VLTILVLILARIDGLLVQQQADPCAPVELLELSFNDKSLASSASQAGTSRRIAPADGGGQRALKHYLH
jgi:hypothetical protein